MEEQRNLRDVFRDQIYKNQKKTYVIKSNFISLQLRNNGKIFDVWVYVEIIDKCNAFRYVILHRNGKDRNSTNSIVFILFIYGLFQSKTMNNESQKNKVKQINIGLT